MRLTDLDGAIVYIKDRDLIAVCNGTSKRPSKIKTPSGEPVIEDKPVLVLLLHGTQIQPSVAVTDENRAAIEEAMNAYAG